MISSAASALPRPAYRRRIRYVDSSIQRSLLLATVALEVVLVVALTWLAYWHLNEVIEEGMYRVHIAQSGPTFTRMMEEGLVVLGLFAVLNVLALIVVERIWSYHENRALQAFAGLMGKTRGLDFSSDAEVYAQHKVLALAAAWRARERTRFAAIRDQVAKLEADASAKKSPQDMRNALKNLNELLS